MYAHARTRGSCAHCRGCGHPIRGRGHPSSYHEQYSLVVTLHMHAKHALEAARAKPYSAGENHSSGRTAQPSRESAPFLTQAAQTIAHKKASPAVLIGKQGMPTFELTLKLCPYGLEVVVEAEVYVRGAETVTILLYFVALAIAEFTEAGHEVPVTIEVN